MVKTAQVELHYQNLITMPPERKQALYGQACSNDQMTIKHWRDSWINHAKACKERFGNFADHGLGKLFQHFLYKPCIVAGAGPSLKNNAHLLKERGNIGLISCLHNYHFLEDHGANVDFYVSLDAGEVVTEELSEGGKRTAEEYWASTKDRKLLAFIGSHPSLFEKWQGEVYLFNAPVPDKQYMEAVESLEIFHTYVGSGGNVLGACMYIAKAIMGANPIIYVGADFSFSYDRKFHAWDSKYDQDLGKVRKAHDVYGMPKLCWDSYLNFKSWFEYIALNVPGSYYNCTEGGCLGSYPEGNIDTFKYVDLEVLLNMYGMSEQVRAQCEDPTTEERKLLF